MEGIKILQIIPGSNNILIIIIGCILICFLLFLIVLFIIQIKDGDDIEFAEFVMIGIIVLGLTCLYFTNEDYKNEHSYQYVTIDDSVSLNEFDKYYTIIKHENNSELWLIQEKEIKEEND